MYNFTSSNWVKGKFGKALKFDGNNNAVNMYSSNFASQFNGNIGTIVAWVKVKNASVWSDGTLRYIFFFVPNNTDRFDISKSTSANKMHFYYRTNGADYLYEIGDSTVNPTTDWFHVAITWDTEAGKLRAYFNGQLIDSESAAPATWTTPFLDHWTAIGAARSDFPGNIWDGYIDDVRVYNYSRPKDKLQKI